MPMNAGCLRPIEIVIPEGSMLSPALSGGGGGGQCRDVSQAVTDALFGALGVLAAAQGTMNNLTFGNERPPILRDHLRRAPARATGFDGAVGGAHAHDQFAPDRSRDSGNAFPVVLQDFHIMRGSGGKGKWNAGDGVSRTIRFLEDMQLAILSGHRVIPPAGTQGGGSGRLGRNLIRRANGHIETLLGCDQTQVHPGDSITIETPTGGGFGKA